jgi:transcriptional regulator with XRE-family HTH domain
MGKPMKYSEPTIRRQELGEQLRTLRENADLTLAHCAKRLCISPSMLSRIETGKRTPTSEDVSGLLALYELNAKTRKELLHLAREAGERGWWQRDKPSLTERQRTLISLESKASMIVNFEPLVIPGLLQTGEYTRAIMTESGLLSEKEVEDGMVTRLRRHSVLVRRDQPKLLAIINELALHQLVGGVDVMRRQLEQMVEWSDRPNISIRVLPNAEGHAAAGVSAGGPFAVLYQPDHPTVVFLENLTSSLFVEEPNDVDVYRQALRNLVSRALDERQSVDLIAAQAKCLDTGAGADEPHPREHSELEEEQP